MICTGISVNRQVDLTAVKSRLDTFFRFEHSVKGGPGAKSGIPGEGFNGVLIEGRIFKFEYHFLYPVPVEHHFEIGVIQFLNSVQQFLVGNAQSTAMSATFISEFRYGFLLSK